jgi:ribose/xylose/arabinose/galactoside ABC-type transport system permease subunit
MTGVTGTIRTEAVAALRGSRAAWAFGVLGVTWLAAILFADGFDSVSNVRYLVQTASFLGIVAVGQTLVVIMSGIDLSVSGVVALSAVVCAKVASGSGGGASGIVAALALSALVGAVNAGGVVWLRVPPMVMTLATGTILSGALLVYTDGSPSSAHLPLLDSSCGWSSRPSPAGCCTCPAPAATRSRWAPARTRHAPPGYRSARRRSPRTCPARCSPEWPDWSCSASPVPAR